MAFVFRAPRESLSPSSNHTPGPGHYQLPRSNSKPSLTPFLTSAQKNYIVNNKQNIPGPGSYSPEIIKNERPASVAAFRSQTRRFKKEEEIGVESCTPELPWVKITKRPNTSKPQGYRVVAPPTIPSIPVAAQSFGYIETDLGLRLHQPIQSEITRPDTSSTSSFTPLKSISFTKSDRKSPSKALDVPGVGHYNAKLLDSSKSVTSVFSSKAERWKRIDNKSNPAPGQYYKPFNYRAKKSRVPFGSTAGKFEDLKKDVTPAVGEYNVQLKHFKNPVGNKLLRKKVHLKKLPFNSTSTRFFSHHVSSFKEEVDEEKEVVVNENSESRTKSTGFRFCSSPRFKNNSSFQAPPVGRYSLDRPKFDRKPSAAFKDSSKRWSPQIVEAPPVGLYDPSHLEGKKGVIISSSSRFLKEKIDHDVPPVGTYTIPSKIGSEAKNILMKASSKRFSSQSNAENIGPGSYDFVNDNSWLKKSFNVTIADDIFQQK